MKPPTLSDINAFLLIAEHLNFRRAAGRLGVTPSALSHTIRALEGRLGTQLLARTTRSVALTEAGARLADRLRPAVAGIREAFDNLAEHGDTLVGRITITSMEHGARMLVGQLVNDFRRAHPAVAFEISVDTALVDLVGSGCDAGIRLREQVPPDMVAIPIGPRLSMVACASPAYLGKRPAPLTPGELSGHECIRQRLSTGTIYRWEFERDGQAMTIEPQGGLTCNNLPTIVAAALAGQGISFTPSHHVSEHVRSGALVELLAVYSPPFDGLCLFYPKSRHPTRTFKAFVDHVRQSMPSGQGT